jgi:serine/threonine-protein kinase
MGEQGREARSKILTRAGLRTALATAIVAWGFASTASAFGADPVLEGTYRLDFDGAHRIINGGPSPTADTSATYSFTPSCTGDGCVVNGVLLSSTDIEAVSAHNPDVTLRFVDGVWQLSLPYDSPCEEGGERNQLLFWSLTPQGGTDVLSGTRTVATIGHSCAGDAPGPLSQPMTATRVGKAAPGVLPMP